MPDSFDAGRRSGYPTPFCSRETSLGASGPVTILCTADLHGRVEPVDPLSGEPRPGGLARVATLLARERARAPGAIYLDLGDLVQGTPVSYWHAKERPDAPHPLVRCLNRLGCEGLVVGNHEFNFGLRFLEAQRRHARFPLLAANVLGPDGRPFFEPVLRVERRGLRLAILAITTPQVPRWEEPWNWEGLTFLDAVETVREWLPRLRKDADAVIVAAHMGWEGVTDGSLEAPAPAENDVGRLVREVGELDAVLMAHTHDVVARRAEGGAFLVQPGARGRALGRLAVTAGGAPRAEGAVLEAGLDVPPDDAVLALVRVDEERGRARIADVVGVAEGTFEATGARWGDNSLLTLLHKVQLGASGAMLSSTALFREDEHVHAGPIRIADLFRVCPFENDLTILELTVDDVREYLEQIAIAYLASSESAAPPQLHPKIELYNHDALAGVEYVIDPARAPGERIVDLSFGGETWTGGRHVTLALSSYRAQGGGGYAALRRARVVERTGREIRKLLEGYIRERGTIVPETFGNWRVLIPRARTGRESRATPRASPPRARACDAPEG
jgi:2',3'-cyclic-nucleotide 2'-phosphodiesterase/3'-nucleotidase